MKKERGITIITLSVTIIILIILTFTISVNMDEIGNRKKKSRFESDLNSLKEEINQYYIRVKEIPIINKYTNTSMLNTIKNVNDGDEYYVIDIRQLEVKLNYGTDYTEIVNNRNITEEISDLTDVYIINKQSHTIYYPKGIEYNGQMHYTLKETYNMIKVENYVNKPELLEGMTPIKFTMPTDSAMGETVVTTASDENWYQYGTTYETRKWANAQTQDGSMWVWIPRFAYKITYYTDNTKQEVSNTKTAYGNIDVVFLIGITDNYYDENGTIKKAQRQTKLSQIIDTTADYTVHPAFTNESSINYVNGGWDEELKGIWVAKFEAGYASGNNTAEVKASNVNYSQTTVRASKTEGNMTADGDVSARNWLDGIYGETTTAIKYPTFQGTTYAMNYINANDAYKISKALTNSGNIYGLNNSNADSHLMKNSEWGAVAYLSASKYGLDGNEMTNNNINLNSGNVSTTKEEGNTVAGVYAITGCTTNSKTANQYTNITIQEIKDISTNNTTTKGVYVWNQKIGQNASSSGNIYGIYDLSGGMLERTSSYISNGNAALEKYAKSIVYNGNTLRNASTKYITIYPNNEKEETDYNKSSQKNFLSNTQIYGDAVRETSTDNAGTSNTGWGTSSWNNDLSYYPAKYTPLFERGGLVWDCASTGMFAFVRSYVYSDYIHGFRTVLVNL